MHALLARGAAAAVPGLCAARRGAPQHPPPPRAAAPAAPRRRAARRPAPRLPVARSIRGIASVDGSVLLDDVSREMLTWGLSTPEFLADAAAASGLPQGASLRFTGALFQPIPWSPTSRYGMPQEFEVYRDKSRYMIVQIPGKMILDAMVKGIPRICAVLEICAAGDGGDGGAPAPPLQRPVPPPAWAAAAAAAAAAAPNGAAQGGCGCGSGGGGGGGGGCGGGGGAAA
ncbi:hypothetical protein Rsub_12713 [Raphidocelis subcapitata]|uniref:Uncharacterized protein n=1 Tax=Raphidocelis subcapitata TaxID=307507 RepID=A0A2V0PJT4_9CHLO|nr:hypothetical protein Rsub_12713 [Raphidocelis subcapitata]|eukprot:GBF99986.1 hypothetical protein Rsub_12713 [Raphidocelis subcapitata]